MNEEYTSVTRQASPPEQFSPVKASFDLSCLMCGVPRRLSVRQEARVPSTDKMLVDGLILARQGVFGRITLVLVCGVP